MSENNHSPEQQGYPAPHNAGAPVPPNSGYPAPQPPQQPYPGPQAGGYYQQPYSAPGQPYGGHAAPNAASKVHAIAEQPWVTWAGFVAGIVIFISAFLPWVSASAFGDSISYSGVSSDGGGDGIFTLLCGIAIGALCGVILFAKQYARTKIFGIATVVLSAITVLIMFIDMGRIGDASEAISYLGGDAGIGIGMIFTLLAALVALAAGILLILRKETPRLPVPPRYYGMPPQGAQAPHMPQNPQAPQAPQGPQTPPAPYGGPQA
ncbi:hypothetical protein [Trueperella sp. LYQ143]|uniref:hypothetical protein n=1 Tax=Trueperella sp. LYQ143 TaxID=3391059 RepID=UPI003983850D